jgi:hypothetical protein
MALTAEQQAQIDVATAIENARNANQVAAQTKQAKLTAIQIAQQTLIANSNNQPVSDRQISAANITAFADTLASYVNA